MKKRIFENPLINDRIMLVESSDETGGEHTLIEVELRPGGGKRLHYHKCITEKFTAIKGGNGSVYNPANRLRLPLIVCIDFTTRATGQ